MYRQSILFSCPTSCRVYPCNETYFFSGRDRFAEYIEEVYAAYEQHRLETMDTMRGGKWSNVAEMTEEEALAEQQKMFAEARARMNGGPSAPKQPSEPHNQPTPNN
ncbi:Protein Dr1 homolog [Striga hermonthica]|uniref:Protein Dr1 homolog n=1 Tax=Striga hermonthica TaxID=68872 RepID=A0A9N7RJB6_STRHE|nr:Protein Dr1 homolog [Striga hermonthica]